MNQNAGHSVVAESGASANCDINLRWCECIIDALLKRGVRYAVNSPGGRSAAMSKVLIENEQITTITHTDERSGAFMALGVAKVTGCPVIVCTTSGSAVANLLPAAMEAKKSNLPIILLTCDKVDSMAGNDALQVADHIGMLRPGVRMSVDLPVPKNQPNAQGFLDQEISKLLPFLRISNLSGPIHINVRLPGEFTSIDDLVIEGSGTEELKAWVATEEEDVELAGITDTSLLIESLQLKPGMKGLIVAGCESTLTNEQMSKLVECTGFPVLADASSGYRRPEVAINTISNADIVVFNPEISQLQVDIIIRIGLAPCTHTMHKFLRKQSCPTIKIGSGKKFTDFMGLECYPIANEGVALRELGKALSFGDADWRHKWEEVSALVDTKISGFFKKQPWGELLAANIVCNTNGFDFLHLANSMSVRHGNLFCKASDSAQPIYGNRGVNGIDGTLGTFFGEVLASDGPGLLLLGDLAFIHDLPALEVIKLGNMNGCICVMNNNGGGLFSVLSNNLEHLRNPVSVNLAGIAAAFGLHYECCNSTDKLDAALSVAKETQGITLIDIRVSPSSVAQGMSELLTFVTV